jgi:hypothetical protein
MARSFQPITGGFTTGPTPGRTRIGSRAHYRKGFGQSAKSSMDDIVGRYTDIIRNLQHVTPQAVKSALWPAYLSSQVYVPIDTGELKSSGRVEVEQTSKNRVRGWILYGSATVWYAAIVHERTDLRHDAPTSAKFLQRAMLEQEDQFRTILAYNWAQVIT